MHTNTLRLLKLTLLLCTLTLILGVKAQNMGNRINVPETYFYGQLVDSLTKEPLRAAVISVVTKTLDSGNRLVRNYISDDKGRFRFMCHFSPYHRMEVAMLGYKPYVRDLELSGGERDFGTILLSHSTQAIDEVVVKSRLQMYKMKGDTVVYIPRAVNTMSDDAALEILRQMPGVEVGKGGSITILGQPVERTYVNQKLLFGDDPTAALRELDAKEVASIEAYDEVDEADAVTNGANARKRKVLNVVTFKDFTQSYSGNARAEMGTDFHKNAEQERTLRYLASGNVNFFSERLQLAASGGSNNLTAQDGRPPTRLSQRQSFANAKVSGRSDNAQHRYGAGYSYGGGFEQTRSSSSVDYFPTDYFTSQHRQSDTRSERESNSHKFAGDYGYTKEGVYFGTSLNASFFNGSGIDESIDRLIRDGKEISSNDVLAKSRNTVRQLQWQASGGFRFKGGNSLSLSARTRLNGGQTRGERYESRTISDVDSPLAWETYSPKPDNTVGGDVGYTFNFDKSGNLTFDSGVQYAGRAERQFYTDLETGLLDVVRSDDAFDKTTTWRTGSEYSIRGKHYNFIARLNYVMENRRYDDTKIGSSDSRNYNFVTSNISYKYSRPKNNFWIGFSNGYSPVQSRYLSSRIDDVNPLYVSTGNRSLLPEKNYTLSLRGEFMGEKASYGFDVQMDAITDPTILRRRFFKEATHLPEYDNYLMPAGSTLTTRVNAASYLRLGVKANYKVRIAPLRLFVEVAGEYEVSNPEEELYDKKERELRHGVGLQTNITTNFSKKFRINVRNRAGMGFLKRFGVTTRDFRDVLKGTMEWDIVKWLHLRADYTGIFTSSSILVAIPNTHLLNLSLGCRVLKERGRVSLNVYDVLDDYSPIKIMQSLDAISQNIEYVGSNYFTVSFEYKFNNRKATM